MALVTAVLPIKNAGIGQPGTVFLNWPGCPESQPRGVVCSAWLRQPVAGHGERSPARQSGVTNLLVMSGFSAVAAATLG